MTKTFTTETETNQSFSYSPALKDATLENFVAQTFDCECIEEVESIVESWMGVS
jgi:hypothetical protein